MALALLSVVRSLIGTPAQPAATSPTTTTANRTQRVQQRGPRRGRPTAPVLEKTSVPRVRLDLLRVSEETKYEGAGRNIFRAEAEAPIPQPLVPPINRAQTPVPTGPPPPPPINLKFFGFANRPGEPKKAFLSQGDAVFIASEGDLVNNRYKVLHIGVNSIEIQDVLNNNTQTIPLTQG